MAEAFFSGFAVSWSAGYGSGLVIGLSCWAIGHICRFAFKLMIGS